MKRTRRMVRKPNSNRYTPAQIDTILWCAVDAVVKGPYDKTFAMQFSEEINGSPRTVRGKWTKSVKFWENTMRAALILESRRNPEVFSLNEPPDEDYGGFNITRTALWLERFKGIEMFPAREGSPSLFIRGPEAVVKKMASRAVSEVLADEVDFVTVEGDKVLRLWWD